jgi:hypothetical protein
MFRRLLVAAGAAALLGGLAAPAFAATSVVPHFNPSHSHVIPDFKVNETEIQSLAYNDSNYVLNNYNGATGNNNLVSEWNDVGQARTYFKVTQRGTYNGDGIYTFTASDGANLSDWDNSSPAIDGYRGRMVYGVNGSLSPAAEWVAVPVTGSSTDFYLENYSTVGEAAPLFLTTDTNATDTPAWTDTSLEVGGFGAPNSQVWSFKVPAVHPQVVVDESQSLFDASSHSYVTPANANSSEANYINVNFAHAYNLDYKFVVKNTSGTDLSGLNVAANVAVTVSGETTGSTAYTETVTVPLTFDPYATDVASHASETVYGSVSETAVVTAVKALVPTVNTVTSISVVETPVVTASGVTVVNVVPPTLTANYSA